MNTKPSTMPLEDVVPACLRARPQWVVWRYERLDPSKPPTKVPYSARSGAKANATRASTWSSFEEAVAVWRSVGTSGGNSGGTSGGGYDGVGFVFSADDPYCGVDLDDCIDPATGELKPWGRREIEALDSYSEISPSGCGVKVIVRATKAGQRCKTRYEDGEVEIYDHDRYFTITGNRLPGVSSQVEPRQEALDRLYVEVFGPPDAPGPGPGPAPGPDDPSGSPVPAPGDPLGDGPLLAAAALPDDEILALIRRSKQAAKFTNLWNGNWNGHFASQSEADSSVVFTLAFYTKDAAQIDRIFRGSRLFRLKWDEKHGAKTYGQMTIDNALEKVTDQYRPRRPKSRCESGEAGPPVEPELDDEGQVALGQREPATGRLVLSPKRTLPTAEAFVGQFYTRAGCRTLHNYAGTHMAWRGNRYAEIEDGTVRNALQPWLHDALRYQFNKASKQMELVPFESNPTTVNAALETVRNHTHLPAGITPPCWLDPPEPGDAPDASTPPDAPDRSHRPDPRNLLPYPTGTLDLTTGVTIPPTPALFNINAIDFDYTPDPHAPERWISFLEQLWGDDLESVQLLQEWMGYCLVADTSQQKMLLMVGPKRSGKGTIGRVLRKLVGEGNVVGPTTSSLGGAFGLQPLIGKSLAIVSDARFGGDNIGVVVERLLCISGEDTLTVDRKFLGSVTMKLPTRFVFLTNELPRMHDSSGALAGRFVILRLTRSFYGQEDPTLTQALTEELPGILVWAIDGLRRLRERGRFLQPASATEAVREMEDLASPVLAFVRDCCEVGAGRRSWIDELYEAWKFWCERDGRSTVTSKQVFGRDLSTTVPSVQCRRHSVQGRFYDGIALRRGGAL